MLVCRLVTSVELVLSINLPTIPLNVGLLRLLTQAPAARCLISCVLVSPIVRGTGASFRELPQMFMFKLNPCGPGLRVQVLTRFRTGLLGMWLTVLKRTIRGFWCSLLSC